MEAYSGCFFVCCFGLRQGEFLLVFKILQDVTGPLYGYRGGVIFLVITQEEFDVPIALLDLD